MCTATNFYRRPRAAVQQVVHSWFNSYFYLLSGAVGHRIHHLWLIEIRVNISLVIQSSNPRVAKLQNVCWWWHHSLSGHVIGLFLLSGHVIGLFLLSGHVIGLFLLWKHCCCVKWERCSIKCECWRRSGVPLYYNHHRVFPGRDKIVERWPVRSYKIVGGSDVKHRLVNVVFSSCIDTFCHIVPCVKR